jgi:fumarate reductase subunit C
VIDNARTEARLWLAQRASSAVLAVCVVVHLSTIVYATRGGLSGAEILARTRGNGGWLTFYLVFVLAAAVHVPIGLRVIAVEWLGWRGASLDWVLSAFAVVLAVMGFAALWGLFL